MGGRKDLKIIPNSWFSTVQKGPNFTEDTGESYSTAVPKESQIGSIRSSTPPLHESTPKSKLAPSGYGTKSSSMAAAESPIWSTVCSTEPFPGPPASPSASNLETLASTAASAKISPFPGNAASYNSVASVPNYSKKTKKKPKENPDSPLPLICITRFLKGIDHCPHFLHLREYSGIVREQLESAWDQAFIETANQIQVLKSKDFWVKGIELWKATADLQTMGYNLIPLRRRLLEVRDAMLESEQAKRKILALKEKVAEHKMEMDRLQEEISWIGLLHDEVGLKRLIALMEAERMKKQRPKYNVLMSDLAKKSFGPGDYVDNEGLMRV